MNLYPSKDALLPGDRPVDVDVFRVAQRYPASRLLECYCRERINGVDIDGLEDSLGAAEDDGGIPGDVGLASVRRVLECQARGRVLQQDGGHPNAQYSTPGASIGVDQARWLA